jgi:hypothetical protein
MGEKAERIERHIEQQRSEVRDNMLELKQKVRRSVDWRAQVDERPLAMVGLAFGAGFLISALLGTGKSRPDFGRMSSDDTRAPEESSHGATWEVIRGAVIGLAATRLKEIVEELVPGFQEEYQKAEARRVVRQG